MIVRCFEDRTGAERFCQEHFTFDDSVIYTIPYDVKPGELVSDKTEID